jgi:hypothetical protein
MPEDISTLTINARHTRPSFFTPTRHTFAANDFIEVRY